MTSKRKLRAVIERLEARNAVEPWTAHLARVADAARAEGRRTGWTEAWAAGAYADEDAYSRGYAAAVADLQLVRLPEPAPEPAGGCQADASPDGPCCGFACCCQHPPVAGWAPGSVAIYDRVMGVTR